jgi:magnesium chelatase family protein
MKLLSFIDENDSWIPVEVELELWPGLPEIHFLGRADQHLRESAKRIKSAIRAQGFEFPVAQQILVNLKPSYLKKSSRGLELAVAAAYLMESGQVPKWVTDSKTSFYGELSLTGEVSAPDGIAKALLPDETCLVTGSAKEGVPFAYREVATLKDLFEPRSRTATAPRTRWAPSEEILDLEIGESWARFLALVALGRHSVLLAGAAGTGKTTAAQILHALLPAPKGEEASALLRRTPGVFPEVAWRPFVRPHHSIPLHSLLGGGPEAHGGELARADLGLLLLDELLEFHPHVMEALREPLEQKKMRVSRGPRVQEYPLRTQIVATTNLCPCGEFVPGEPPKQRCRFTLARCRSYGQRISGPLADRFEILRFVKFDAAETRISVRELRVRLEETRARLESRGRRAGEEALADIKARVAPFFLKHDWDKWGGSERRRIATLRVAQTVCDWEGESQITGSHLEEARRWTVHAFEKLKRWDVC